MHPPAAAGGDHATATPAPATGAAAATASDYAHYPRLSPEDVAPPPPPPYHAAASSAPPYSGNPYVSSPAGGVAPASKSAFLQPNLPSVVGRITCGVFFFLTVTDFPFCRYNGYGEGCSRQDGEEVWRGGSQDGDPHRQLLATL